jgi:capsular exopolysaccharide synthesis family protein
MDQDKRPPAATALVPGWADRGAQVSGSPATTPRDGDEPGSTLGIKTLWRALCRRWFLALVLAFLLVPAATVVAWYVIPTRHTARTLLHVESTQPSILATTVEGGAHESYQRTQLALVKSRLVLNAALRQEKVADLPTIRQQARPAQWLEKEVKADYKLAPEVMSISLSGDREDDLIAILNAVREAYLQEVVEKEQNLRRAKLRRLQELFADYDNVLRDKRRTLRGLAEEIGSGNAQNLAAKQKFALERLSRAQNELLQLQSELRRAMVEAANQGVREKVLDKVRVPESVISQQIRHDVLVEQYTQEVAKLEHIVEQLKKTFVIGEKAPAVQVQQSKLDAARNALKARKEYLRPLVLKELQEKAKEDLEVSGAQAQSRIGVLAELEKSVARDVAQMEKENQSLNKRTLNLESLQEDLSQVQEVARRIGAQMETLKVELQAPSRVQLLEEASVNADETKKRRMMAAGGAGLGILAAVLFGVACFESRSRRISTAEEVKLGAGMRLVGTLPVLSAPRAGTLVNGGLRPGHVTSGHRLLLESLDAMRTVLMHTARSEKFKVVMVTSALSGEGKTSLSSQLAASVARGGFNTLLIDGDLRRPTLHRLLELSKGPGLCELMRGESTVDQVIQPTIFPGLSLISAGQFDAKVLQALACGKSKEILEEIKGHYDLVVVDSSPVLPVADALLLGQYVDGVIFSILRDVSRMPPLQAACERIGMLGIRILGAVVAGLHARSYYSAYGYNGGSQEASSTEMLPASKTGI